VERDRVGADLEGKADGQIRNLDESPEEGALQGISLNGATP